MDEKFTAQHTYFVGHCISPPEHAPVLCVDEKSQIQALDRTQPGLPLKKGRAAAMTHDYKRQGVTTLHAAMDVKSGLVIGGLQAAPPCALVYRLPAVWFADEFGAR